MLNWELKYRTGVAEIDDEHKEIINSFNILAELVMKTDDQIYFKEFLAFLQSYVVNHFSNEERIMLTYGYPEYKVHKDTHELFKVTVYNWINESKQRELNLYEIKSLLTVAEKWFEFHLDKEDFKLAEFLIEQRE